MTRMGLGLAGWYIRWKRYNTMIRVDSVGPARALAPFVSPGQAQSRWMGVPIDHIRRSWFHSVVGLAPGIFLAGFPEIVMVVNEAAEPVLFFV